MTFTSIMGKLGDGAAVLETATEAVADAVDPGAANEGSGAMETLHNAIEGLARHISGNPQLALTAVNLALGIYRIWRAHKISKKAAAASGQ